MTIPYDCFISYASTDLPLAERLNEQLVSEGFAVWFDRIRLKPGFDWYKEIETGCEQSRILLPILTPEWKKSEWTRFETYGSDAIIPIVARGTWEEVKTGPLSRWQAQFHDLTSPSVDKWNLLFESIRRALSKPVPEKATRIASLRYRPNPYFVGRENKLLQLCEELHDFQTAALTQGQVRAISALGGIGKTTLASEYAHKFWRLYPQIFWVDARLGYQAEFARIYDTIVSAGGLEGPSQAEKAAVALQRLSQRESRLLIIDNVLDEKTVNPWIPKAGGCHTLLTSRFADFSAAIKVIDIDVLGPLPARDFLQRRSGHAAQGEDAAACNRLAEVLGYLPLALEISAAYIRLQGETFGFLDYLRLYEAATKELLSEHKLGSTEYPDPVITTWKATIEKLQPEAKAILRLCSCLAATPIPLELFLGNAETVCELAKGFGDIDELTDDKTELRMRDAVGGLKSFSMAGFDGTDLQLHPLVQTVEWLNASEPEQKAVLTSAIEFLHDLFPEEEFENWSLSESLVPHVEKVTMLASENLGPTLAELLSLTGQYLGATVQFARAEPLLRRGLAIDEAFYGPDDTEVATDLNNLANLLEETNRFAEAERLLRRALTIQEARFGPDHVEVAVVLNNLAGVLQSTNQYIEAEKLYRLAIKIDEANHGPNHPELARDLNNLAFLLEYIGRRAEAEPLFRRALKIDEDFFGADNREVAKDLINLSDILVEQGHVAEAEPLCRRAIAIDEVAFGLNHPDYATDLSSLGYLLNAANRFSEAEQVYRRALEIHEATLGSEHHKVALDLGYLADLLVTTNRPGEAELLYRRALQINETTFGPSHPDTARMLYKLADTLSKLRNDPNALPMAERACALLSEAFSDDHPWAKEARDVTDAISLRRRR